MTKAIKLNSFAALAELMEPEKKKPTAWETFLSERGQCKDTFVNLPEHIKINLHFKTTKSWNLQLTSRFQKK